MKGWDKSVHRPSQVSSLCRKITCFQWRHTITKICDCDMCHWGSHCMVYYGCPWSVFPPIISPWTVYSMVVYTMIPGCCFIWGRRGYIGISSTETSIHTNRIVFSPLYVDYWHFCVFQWLVPLVEKTVYILRCAICLLIIYKVETMILS